MTTQACVLSNSSITTMVIPPSLDWGWGWVRYVHRVFLSSEGEENTNRTQFVTACRVHRKLTATSLDFSKKHRWINTRALLFIYYIIICSFSFSSFFSSSLSSLFSFKLAFFFLSLEHTHKHTSIHTHRRGKNVLPSSAILYADQDRDCLNHTRHMINLSFSQVTAIKLVKGTIAISMHIPRVMSA